ncbi:MAG TPA: phosphotransferase [Steroidobacteraceae bacterium]
MIAAETPRGALIATELAEKVAREHYGIEARAERLTGEWDENFRLHVAGAPGYVLKVAHASERPEVMELPTAALLHVARVDPELPCPRVVPSCAGSNRVTFLDAGGAPRTAFLYTFLLGEPLMMARRSPVQRAACGRLLARLGHTLREFSHPATRRILVWDLKQLPRIREVLRQLPDLKHTRFFSEFLARYETEILPRLSRLRSQPVHNDFNARNLLVDPNAESRITGIIDFGDLVHTALVADVAVGAIGQLAAPDTAERSIREFVAGYCGVEPLIAEELDVLGWLVAGRIVQNVVVTSWYRARNSSAEHFESFNTEYFEWRIALAERLAAGPSPFR